MKLPPTTRPSLLVADGRRGVYVVGRLTTGGKLRIVHVLPDGTVDPAFRATVGPGSIFGGAVRGRELALIGAFRRIDGQRRRDIAVLDATTGRLRSWAPSLPSATRGQGLPHVVFTANRLVAASVGAVTAWTDGASKPIWVHRLPTGSHHDETPEIASWRGSILATAEGMLFSIRPGSGRAQIADRDFRWEDFANVGGRLFYGVESDYYVYGVHARPRCGQETANFSAGPVAGTTRTLFVSSGPVDVDPTGPARSDLRLLAGRPRGSGLHAAPVSVAGPARERGGGRRNAPAGLHVEVLIPPNLSKPSRASPAISSLVRRCKSYRREMETRSWTIIGALIIPGAGCGPTGRTAPVVVASTSSACPRTARRRTCWRSRIRVSAASIAAARRSCAARCTWSSRSHSVLTPSELEVLCAAANGLTSSETAHSLVKGEATVKTQRRQILLKLGARNIAHAVCIATEDGIVRCSDSRDDDADVRELLAAAVA